jgi:hypothetical protein
MGLIIGLFLMVAIPAITVWPADYTSVPRDRIEKMNAYRTAGLTQVVHKTYADGRHESPKRDNCDLVTRDLISATDQGCKSSREHLSQITR